MPMPLDLKLTRRDLIKSSGALVVTMNLSAAGLFASKDVIAAIASTRSLNPAELDAWLAVDAQGIVTAYWGKLDLGQGVDTAIAQMVAEELDVPVDRVNVVYGDTTVCVDQGGASGSSGIADSGVALRAAAAEARLVLLEKASAQLQVPLDSLTVKEGVISNTDASKSVSYAELVGNKLFGVPIEWNGKYGNPLGLNTRATLKDPADYQVVGTPVRRKDIAGKILAETEFAVHVRVPDMLHGRMVRPKVAGARIKSVDRDSIAHIPGVQVVVEQDFVGVVAPIEWDAIKASHALKVDWDETDAGFPTTSEQIHDYIRQAKPGMSDVGKDIGNVDNALAGVAQVIDVEYEWPFQSHARMGPAFGLADVKEDHVTVWTDSQKFYDAALCAGKLAGLDMDTDKPPVRGIWKPGPGSYGRSDAGDGVADAVLLSKAVGAPVRMQWSRYEGLAWDPKGPASVSRMRAGIDADGNVVAYHFNMKGFSKKDISSREDGPGEVLAGQLLGHTRPVVWELQQPGESYNFANKRYSWEAIPPLRVMASPLRCSHFRDPNGAEAHFATESFIDELAHATGQDPVQFRLKYVTDPRDKAVIETAANLANWDTRPSPNPNSASGDIQIGRGIAYAQRNGATNAIVAEVEVNRLTGRVWVRRYFVGSDHGLIINPFTLDRTIEGNLMQATSRTLFEEVKFDKEMVRPVDWATYPLLSPVDVPLEVIISKINRPELGPMGAGEPVTRVVPGAIANAFFDATGVRLRRVPYTPERVLAALRV